MVEDRISNSIRIMGYQQINSNIEGIYLFYQRTMEGIAVVSVLHAMDGTSLTKYQYEHIVKQIRDNFQNSVLAKVKILSLIYTNSPNQAKQLFENEDENTHWIIDVASNRLIIYETQASEFDGLRNIIETLLQEEQLNPSETAALHYDERDGSGLNGKSKGNSSISSRIKLFTLVNTIVIGINILAYIIVHYTGLFGGTELLMERGALSWYYVKEKGEYYRILTSMFMHNDLGHIFNNMLVLLFVGDNLERAAGKLRYLFIYFGAGILAGITSIGYNMWKETEVFSIGASGAIFGIVGAMLYIVIVNKGCIENISTRQMILFTILSLYGGLTNIGIDQAAHIGGFIGGLLLAAILYRRPKQKQDTLNQYREIQK
jgi:rhomboid protease GluP